MYVPELRPSPNLNQLLLECLHSDHLESSAKQELAQCLKVPDNDIKDQEDQTRHPAVAANVNGDVSPLVVPVKLVRDSIEALNKGRSNPLYIHEALKDSELHLQKYEPPERSAELEARIQRLKKEADEREYKQMTRNVHRTKKIVDGNIGKELKAMNLQIIAVINFVLTVGGAFVFGYKAAEASMEQPDMVIQITVGMVLGTVVFFADLYFLVMRTM
ncbi:transmembrane protein 199-like [Argonauta hians]